MSAVPERSKAERSNKVIRLRPRATLTQRWATRTAGEVRRHLSLLQGYADLMEGMSAEQSLQILRVMAEKIDELNTSLRPFTQADLSRRNINDFRQTRMRSRQLLTEYRGLLEELNVTLSLAHSSIFEPSAKPKVS